MYLKVMHTDDLSPVDGDNAHSVYADVTSCSFVRDDATQRGSYARLSVREPIKTAMVPGFAENERLVDLNGPAYLMNDNGKTISTFMPSRSGNAVIAP